MNGINFGCIDVDVEGYLSDSLRKLFEENGLDRFIANSSFLGKTKEGNMRSIRFSDVGVVVNSFEELDELVTLYNALDIEFDEKFIRDIKEAKQANLVNWYIQASRGDIKTRLGSNPDVSISIINYPITYAIDSLDFAVAYLLLKSNQEDELIAYLDKHCKEFK